MDWYKIVVAERAEILRMLKQWVSGLEPSVLRSREGRLVGLTIAGLPNGVGAPVVVRAWS